MRLLIDELIRPNDRLLDTVLDSPRFSSVEYTQLKQIIENNKNSLSDLFISDGFVYKRTGFPTGAETLGDNIWKLWVLPDLITAAHYS